MLNYKVLSKKPPVFRNFTGLELQEFDTLNSKIEEQYPAYEQKRLARQDRKRAIGAGHPFNLPLTDRLLMLLVYYHLYLSSNLMAYLFNLSQTNILKDIRKLEPLVSEVLPLPRKEYDKVKRLETVDEIEAMFPGFKAFLDATEQEIPRPHSKRKRKTHYSGKKKKHTVKTQLTVNKEGLIVHKTRHVRGSIHDYALYRRSHPRLPDEVRVGGDLGYEGVKKDYPWLNFVVPFRRKSPGRGKRGVKAQKLSPEKKAFNKAFSKERVVVEHTNSRVKKFHIWGDEFRNRLKLYEFMTDIVCGLVNFRISGTLAT
jgi:hypothetical protein